MNAAYPALQLWFFPLPTRRALSASIGDISTDLGAARSDAALEALAAFRHEPLEVAPIRANLELNRVGRGPHFCGQWPLRRHFCDGGSSFGFEQAFHHSRFGLGDTIKRCH